MSINAKDKTDDKVLEEVARVRTSIWFHSASNLLEIDVRNNQG